MQGVLLQRACRRPTVAALFCSRRWEATTASTAATAIPSTSSSSSSSSSAARPSTMDVMERAAVARRDIYDLWSKTAAEEEKAVQASARTEAIADLEARLADARHAALVSILETYKLDPSTPRDEDVSRGLGDALDRLLLLCVPLTSTGGTEALEKLMHLMGRQGRQLSMRTVQHLFARTNSYAEALAIFYAMRRSHFAMNIEAYHAMLYSLQRLEEEGWAQKFHDEVAASKGAVVSEQALDFILRGVDNQLMPENKPWLGRVMFAEAKENAAERRQTRASYDALGKMWVNRYKGEESN